ncbi:MAG: hypothetical protein RIT81_41500 [Deltaproteobacteria bacterium]
MLEDLAIGPVRLRIDFLLIPGGVALATQLPLGVAFLVAILVHELGHAIAHRIATGGPFVLYLQVGGGGSYVRDLPTARPQSIVLLAGPLFTLVPALVGHLVVQNADSNVIAWWGASLRFASLMWAGFQALPFPTLDVGLLLRRWLVKKTESAMLAWRIGWVLGFTVIVLVVTIDFSLIGWALWLTLVAVLLGRAEATYVKHVDAFAAWERKDHQTVLAMVNGLSDRSRREDRMPLYVLGLASALEIEDEKRVETLAAKLPAHHPSALGAGEWLLRRGRAYGAKLAENALEAIDHERVKTKDIDRERYADLTFRYAIHEATELRPDSAMGLLERAVELGFDDLFRLEAEGSFVALHERPRYRAVIDRLQDQGSP